MTLRASAESWAEPISNNASIPLTWSSVTVAVSDFASLTLSTEASNGFIGAVPALLIAVSSMHEP